MDKSVVDMIPFFMMGWREVVFSPPQKLLGKVLWEIFMPVPDDIGFCATEGLPKEWMGHKSLSLRMYMHDALNL